MAYIIKSNWNDVSTNNISEAFYYLEYYRLIRIRRISDSTILVNIKGRKSFPDKKSTMSEVIRDIFKCKPRLTEDESKNLLELAMSNDESNYDIVETIVFNSNILGNTIFKNKNLRKGDFARFPSLRTLMYYLSSIKNDSRKSI